MTVRFKQIELRSMGTNAIIEAVYIPVPSDPGMANTSVQNAMQNMMERVPVSDWQYVYFQVTDWEMPT